MSIYDYTVTDISGRPVPMESFRDHVLLIVNTASKCGFTPQYAGLQKLYDKYKGQKFAVIGFPCNQFGNQEPDGEDRIMESCSLNYGVTFPMMAKVKVNGKDADPLFNYLKSETGGLLGDAIKWNFTKFLIDRDGEVIERFPPQRSPESLDEAIRVLL